MTYSEFRVARQFVAEERDGTRLRAAQNEEIATANATADAMRARGMVAEESNGTG